MARNRIYELFAFTASGSTAIVCLLQMQYSGLPQKFLMIALFAIAAYGVTGLLKTVTCDETIEELHCYAESAMPFLTLPFIATEVWLKHGVLTREVAYAHAVSGVVIATVTMLSTCGGSDVTDFVVLVNALSLAYIGYNKQNIFALYSSGIAVVAHFTHKRCGRSEIERFYDYFLAAFCICAVQAVCY